MPTESGNSDSATEMISALVVARDRARVQAHLFSLDARKRWQELETKLLALQSKLELGGEKFAASATKSFHEVTTLAKELLGELDGTLELATPVRKVMKDAPGVCAPEDSLNRAAQIMWEMDCGVIPVVTDDGSVVGVITDRDICMAAYTRGQSLPNMAVQSAMSKEICWCAPEESIGHAARLMAQKQVRRLPVLERGKLVGVLALADIARHLVKNEGIRTPAYVALAHTLAAICEHRLEKSGVQAAE